jgi:hypothetical protein
VDGFSFGGGFSDLSEQQMAALLRVVDSVQALPSPDPNESVALASLFTGVARTN